MMSQDFSDFNFHLSPTLQWKWRFQDFRITNVGPQPDGSFRVTFAPKFSALFPIVSLVMPTRGPLILISSLRLGCISSIIAAGNALGKTYKDGEVIVKEQALSCLEPVIVHRRVLIDVDVKIDLHGESERYYRMTASFTVGDGKPRHHGTMMMFYCKPGLRNFSYLR